MCMSTWSLCFFCFNNGFTAVRQVSFSAKRSCNMMLEIYLGVTERSPRIGDKLSAREAKGPLRGLKIARIITREGFS